MKSMKRIFAMLLVAAMVLAMGTTGFAAEKSATGTITITNATGGKTYTGYKIFDATYDAANTKAVSYSIQSTSPWYSIVANSDLFLLNEISALTTGSGESTVKTYSVAAKTTATEAAILDLFKSQFAFDSESDTWTCTLKGVRADLEAKSAVSDGDISWTAPFGYYLLTSTLGSLVTIDTNHPNASVIDKNQGPAWDNKPDQPNRGDDEHPGKVIVLADGSKKTESSANYGDTVNFNIGVSGTNYVGADMVTYYYVKDTIGDGFTYVTDAQGVPQVTVTAGKTVLTAHDSLDALTAADSGYVLTPMEDDDGHNGFQITVKWANAVAGTEGEAASFVPIYAPNTEIHVTYAATVNANGENVVLAEGGNFNKANFTYSTVAMPDPGVPEEAPNYGTEEKTTATYVYALAVQKIDSKGNPLRGAEFSLQRKAAGEDDTAATIYGVSETDETGNVIPGVYNFSTAAAQGATTQFKTDENGMLVIKGVAAGSYAIKEELAPEGYNLLTDTVEVEAVLKESYTTTTTVYLKDGQVVASATRDTVTKTYDADYPVSGVAVINNAGTALPATGGMGTRLFYLFGAALMAGAAIVLVVKKRMSVIENL